MSQTGDSSAEILLKEFKKSLKVAISHSKGRNLLLDIVHRIERILEELRRLNDVASTQNHLWKI